MEQMSDSGMARRPALGQRYDDSFAIARHWKGLSANIPQSDDEFPENLTDSFDHRELSDEAKRRMLYKYGNELFAL